MNDSKIVKYSIHETDTNGNIVATMIDNVAVSTGFANDPPNNYDGFTLVSTGRLNGGSNRPEDVPSFSIEVKNLSVTWL